MEMAGVKDLSLFSAKDQVARNFGCKAVLHKQSLFLYSIWLLLVHTLRLPKKNPFPSILVLEKQVRLSFINLVKTGTLQLHQIQHWC